MIELHDLLPAAEQGWLTLFELGEETDSDWVLVGGQMIYLLAEEHGTQLPRPTDDMDVVVDVRTRPGGTAWLSTWLMDRDFEQGDISADGISHRFIRNVEPGPAKLIFDVLAPDGLGSSTDLTTKRPGRTVQTPGGTQALGRSEVIDIQVHCSNPKDRRRLRKLDPLRQRSHHSWALLTDQQHRRGTATLDFLTA